MSHPRPSTAAGAALGVLILLGGGARAQAGEPSAPASAGYASDPCPCIKPWSIPDRWNDDGAPGLPEWANNGRWDSEPFEDQDGYGLWDPGEPFKDLNADGRYTAEFYHPLVTGYLFTKDGGRVLVLKPGPPDRPGVPGQYHVVDFGRSGQEDATGSRYLSEIAGCRTSVATPLRLRPGSLAGPTVRGVQALVARDPSAFWDEASQSVGGSAFATSPRLVLICLHDPRLSARPGPVEVPVVKIAAFFIEGIDPDGDLAARFAMIPAPSGGPGGAPCGPAYPNVEGVLLPAGSP